MRSILMIEKHRAAIPARMVTVVGLSALLLCLMVPVGLRGHVARYEKYTPTSVKLTLHDTPEIRKPVRVTFTVQSEMNLSDVEIEFLAPDGVMLIDTDTVVQTSIMKDQKKEFTATAAIITDRWLGPGGRFVWALANVTASEGRHWGAFGIASTDGVVESGRDGHRYADSLRDARKLRQPSMQEVEDVRDGVGLPDDWDYAVVAAHLWYSELRWLWRRGYSKEESFEVMRDLARYLARKRRTTPPEAIAAIVEEGTFGKLMERRTRMRAFWTPGRIAGISALAILLIVLAGVVLRSVRTRRSVEAR